MEGKYSNRVRYLAVKASRFILRSVLWPLVRWKPLREAEEGYTVIIGAVTKLAPLALANLEALSSQKMDHLSQIIVVFDSVRKKEHRDLEEQIALRLPHLPVKFYYYSRLQHQVSRIINWGWVYAWMSWTIGISHCKSQHAILHDLDALLIEPSALERRYSAIIERKDNFIGIRWYAGNGILSEDHLATTFEMIFDATYVRGHFKPLDVFNHVRKYKGRRVDFDTFLYVQSQSEGRSVLLIDGNQMLHPSQMLCHYTYYVGRKNWIPGEDNTLLMIPYYLFLAGDEQTMQQVTTAITNGNSRFLPLFKKTMDARNLAEPWAAWVREQIERFEVSKRGNVHPSVAQFLNAIDELTERAMNDQSSAVS